MLTPIPGLPPHVVGVEAHGKVTGRDYETVLKPAIDSVARTHDKIRLLYRFAPDFEGFDAAAVWEDTKLGLRHYTGWERVAVVTDTDWLGTGVRAMNFLVPADIKVFPLEENEQAERWIAH